jgi:hypothetical protein
LAYHDHVPFWRLSGNQYQHRHHYFLGNNGLHRRDFNRWDLFWVEALKVSLGTFTFWISLFIQILVFIWCIDPEKPHAKLLTIYATITSLLLATVVWAVA